MSLEILKKIDDVAVQLKADASIESEKKSLEIKNELKSQIETEVKSLEAKLAQAEEDSKKSIQKIEEAINSGFKSVSEKTDSKSYVPLSLKEAQYIAEALNSHKQAKFFIKLNPYNNLQILG